MGAIEKTLNALDAALGGACQVVTICGRNKALMQRLQERWAALLHSTSCRTHRLHAIPAQNP